MAVLCCCCIHAGGGCGGVFKDGIFVCAAGERVDLKYALTKLYSQCKVRTLHSSKLWGILRGEKNPLNVLLVSASELEFSLKEGEGRSL